METQTKLVVPDDVQLIDCQEIAPPDITPFLAADADAREKILMDKIGKQAGAMIVCNARWKGLREWKSDQLKRLTPKDSRG
jgi:hypothetical protein